MMRSGKSDMKLSERCSTDSGVKVLHSELGRLRGTHSGQETEGMQNTKHENGNVKIHQGGRVLLRHLTWKRI